jgi:hypothetical protein
VGTGLVFASVNVGIPMAEFAPARAWRAVVAVGAISRLIKSMPVSRAFSRVAVKARGDAGGNGTKTAFAAVGGARMAGAMNREVNP